MNGPYRRYYRLAAVFLVGVLCLATPSGGQSSSAPATIVVAPRPALEGGAPAAGTRPVAVPSTGRRRATGYSGPRMVTSAQSPSPTALIVLTQQAESETLTALTEDLNIMCRILDRALAQAGLRSDEHQLLARLMFDKNEQNWLGRFFSEDAAWTQCLYVQGYGPLFLMTVDFPLRASPAETAPDEPNEVADPLWAQVAREMSGARTPTPQAAQGAQYNPERVLALKATLTRALKHAANIRGLSDEARVTVVVKAAHTLSAELALVGSLFDSATATNRKTAPLAIRATMKDVRALAGGTLAPNDFEQHVKITQY